jgi:fatty-acyl-CoA synthase
MVADAGGRAGADDRSEHEAPPPRPSLLLTMRAAATLAALVPPLALVLRFTRDERRAHRLVQRCARAVVRLAGCRVRVVGLERMPTQGHAMLVANHASLADAAVLLAALPVDFRFIANHVFAAYPILGAAIRGASHHIVDRGSWRSRADCGRSMVDALAAGRTLLVFPEGTTADDGQLLPFRSGAFRAAARSGTAVVPIAIRGTRQLLRPGTMMLSPATVEIELLPLLRPRGTGRDAVTALRDEAAAAIRERLLVGAERPV